MAGLIKSNVQLGDSATATQNFTLSVPAVPDGTIKLARGNAGATTQDIITVSTNGATALRGTDTNDSAATGFVGEYFEASTLYSSTVTSAVTGISIQTTLQAGDWDVSGVVMFSATSATVTKAAVGVSITTGLPTYQTALQLGGGAYSSGASGPLAIPTPVYRISVAAATTVRLVQELYFGSGTMAVSNAWLRARRVR